MITRAAMYGGATFSAARMSTSSEPWGRGTRWTITRTRKYGILYFCDECDRAGREHRPLFDDAWLWRWIQEWDWIGYLYARDCIVGVRRG